ncbi:MAG: hypothetical protein JSR17_10500 [Proteobacteria bacterium]|nr:hypothetical protein [Pseudomonadota bacterium]
MYISKKLTVFFSVLSVINTVYAEDHFCPSADLVKKNEKNVQAWENNKLYWQIGYRGWPYAEQIGFDQAFFFPKTHKLDCRYKWINPQQPGTYLWTSVLLSPDANAIVEVSGTNWSKKEDFYNCTSGRPETCAFKIKLKKTP